MCRGAYTKIIDKKTKVAKGVLLALYDEIPANNWSTSELSSRTETESLELWLL
jgi:hypothetical protein